MFQDSDLWIFPLSTQSRWLPRVDWYLNWQITKGLAHQSQQIDPQFELIIKEYDVPIRTIPLSAHPPLLVGCKGLVPAKLCSVMHFAGDLNLWLRSIKTVSLGLLMEKLIIFLPPQIRKAEALEIWEKLPERLEARFIEDNEELT